MKKVAYFTNIAPHYREKLWLNFTKKSDVEFHFFFGNKLSQSIEPIDFNTKDWQPFQKQIHKLSNLKRKKRLVYQKGIISQIIFKDWDIIILLGDANIVSNWLAAIIAKMKGIPVIFWGHGLYDGDEIFIKKKIRTTFLALADINLVYGQWAKNIMVKENFKQERIKVIYNSLDYEASKALREEVIIPDFYHNYFNNTYPTLIFIGRLTKVKRLDILLEAVSRLTQKKVHFNLMLIGDGEERQYLENLAKKLRINIHFYGACYNEKEIGQFIANAHLCVSPGNVGLTAIHALSYGTPVCTHNDFKNQMPEFEAIQEGKTGCFFDKSEDNLAETILHWFNKAPQRNIIRQNCYEVIDTKYNPYIQSKVLKESIKEVLG
jgi:glycosyltransferase involved in cell wall biosynthesis